VLAEEEPAGEVPVRELPVRRPASDIPQYGGPDIHDYLGLDRLGDAGDADDEAEPFDGRPRVRVYGCCLPVCLGALGVLLGLATVLAQLVMRAL
jgi:hypothetical protein